MLVHVLAIGNLGERKVIFRVRRNTAFTDAVNQADSTGILEYEGCLSQKIFPVFVDEAVETLEGKETVEGGEGHGPRRDFFECVGIEMARVSHSPKVPSVLILQKESLSLFGIMFLRRMP